jgi:hypothetical protein
LKAPGFNRWNLKCDILVSKFAFRFNLYRYTSDPKTDSRLGRVGTG